MKLNQLRRIIKEEILKEMESSNETSLRPEMFMGKLSVTDGKYHYFFDKSTWVSDHGSLYIYDDARNEIAEYDTTDEWPSIRQNPKLLAAYKELEKMYQK